MSRVGVPVALVCIALAACASLDNSVADSREAPAGKQILVMLRLPSPHFRPDVSYTASYSTELGSSARRHIATDLAARYHLELVRSWPMPALSVDCYVMRVSPNASARDIAQRIALDPRVESAQPMQPFESLGHNDPLYPLQPANTQWHLAEIHEVTTGRNVPVAVIDTGVELDHPDLRGQIALSRNFVDASPYAAEAHGTAVAGIIAARADNGIGIAGVAPGSRLFALRACWQPQSAAVAACNTFTLAKALQFALDQNVRVINLSLTGPHDRLLARLLDVALAQGVAIVAAVDPKAADGGFPASYPGVIGVAADGDEMHSPNVLLAPGSDVPTATPHHAWTFVSGSSYAAAHVTGAAALVLEKAPDIAMWRLRDALAPSKLSGIAREHGQLVDACAAVAKVTGVCACSCAASHDTTSMSHPHH